MNMLIKLIAPRSRRCLATRVRSSDTCSINPLRAESSVAVVAQTSQHWLALILFLLLGLFFTVPTSAAELVFNPADTSASEDVGQATVTVQLQIQALELGSIIAQEGDSATLTADVIPTDGSATSPADFDSSPQSISITIGPLSAQDVADLLAGTFEVDEITSTTIPIVDDSEVEEGETINLTLGNLAISVTTQEGTAPVPPDQVAAAFPNPGVGTLIILDNDTISDDESTLQEELEQVAVTAPQREIARVLGGLCDSSSSNLSSELESDCSSLSGADASELANVLAQITPDMAHVPVEAAVTSVSTQGRNVGLRMGARRRGSRGFSAEQSSFNLDGQMISGRQLANLFNELSAKSGVAAGDSNESRLGGFINGTFVMGDKDGTDNVHGFDFDTQGITFGLDYLVDNRMVLGVALGYVDSEVDFDNNRGELESDGYSLTLYGSYFEAGRFYLDTSVTYGENDYDQERDIRYTLGGVEVNQTAKADFDGEQWDVLVSAGYDFRQGGLTIGPVGRLEYIKTEVDSYREQATSPGAGSGFMLAIDSQEFESVTLSLGGEALYTSSHDWGVLQPQITVEWVHEFEENDDVVRGRFLGDLSGTTFRLPTDETDEDYFNLGIGVSLFYARGLSMYLHYQTVLDFEDLDHETINAGIRLEF